MPPELAVRMLTGPVGRQLFAPIMRDRTAIFMLHRVTDSAHRIKGHEIEFVKRALRALRESGANFISLRSLIEAWQKGAEIDPNSIVFTIDDGFADQGDLVSQAFVPMECPVTVFLISGFLDGKLWPWDDQIALAFETAQVARAQFEIGNTRVDLDLSTRESRHAGMHRVRDLCKTSSDNPYETVERLARTLQTSIPGAPPAHFRPLTWDRVRELERHNVDFAPHSVTHRIFSTLSDEDARTELSTSWARLQSELSHPLPVFAWPTGRAGDFGARDMKLAPELGMHAAVAADAGYATRADSSSRSRYGIHRFPFPHDIATVLRYGSWLERGRQLLPF